MYKKILLLFTFSLIFYNNIFANDGYKLWLQYDYVNNATLRQEYLTAIEKLSASGNSETISVAFKELDRALKSMLGPEFSSSSSNNNSNSLIFGSQANLSEDALIQLGNSFNEINEEGFIIKSVSFKGKKHIIITGKTDIGVLYGVYNFLRLLQTNKNIGNLNIIDSPKIKVRVLNHWDNLDRTVERGYSGFSIWDWHRLPDYIDTRYIDYARANASIGISFI